MIEDIWVMDCSITILGLCQYFGLHVKIVQLSGKGRCLDDELGTNAAQYALIVETKGYLLWPFVRVKLAIECESIGRWHFGPEDFRRQDKPKKPIEVLVWLRKDDGIMTHLCRKCCYGC